MKPSKIAIVGMAGRFPGAGNVDQFWENLRDGIESIRSLTDAELLAAGVSAADIARPGYIKRAAILDDVPMFDASFFGLSPRDAAIMDPQHRHFLECAWQAFEDAAHPPKSFAGSIGVFAGSGMNSYLIHNLLTNRELLESVGLFQLKQTGNDKDVLATRVSYQFDLRGPSINVQTACSTSLVAVHMACQSLLNFECDMTLAGGVTIEIPHGHGYIYREGEILSRDGHCRTFDAAASGTVFGSGVGIVVLRRLEDALADNDSIRAVILGSAINNDGARKVGYLAPSVEGQAEVIAEALDFAGVSADDISYVETHGTGTIVGDPIEIRALTQAFRRHTTRTNYCAIGSLKPNVGHLDAAAGVASLIKTVLSLEHAKLPPSLNFQNPNPHIEFEGSPLFVNNKLADWPSSGTPRRAGITSLGIGGTNAHVVIEEAPPRTQLPRPRSTYPFEHKRFWIEPGSAASPLPAASEEINPPLVSGGVHFYRRGWASSTDISGSFPENGVWVIFNDSLGLGAQISAELEAKRQRVILVNPGSSFKKISDSSYSLRPAVRDDYSALVEEICKPGHFAPNFLHLWSISPRDVTASLAQVRDNCFISPLCLAQSLEKHGAQGAKIALISNFMQSVSNEPVHNPARAMLLGLTGVIPLELPGITCQSIDVDCAGPEDSGTASQIVAEMNSVLPHSVVAFRQGKRFIPALMPLSVDDGAPHRRLEAGGVYLITGGLGGIGIEIAGELAHSFHARLVLVTRSTLPPQDAWQESLADPRLSVRDKTRIEKLIAIRSSAGDLQIVQGDVTDPQSMKRVVAAAISRFGKIDGVLHAAGVLDDGPLMLKTAQSTARVLDPKVRGTLVLETALRDVPLRFIALFSSVSSMFPAPGQVDYAAANAFLDAFALSRRGNVIAVNWGAWRETGMTIRPRVGHPLIDRIESSSQQIVGIGRLSSARDWVLGEHRMNTAINTEALLPGTAYLEMAFAAFSKAARATAAEFRDVLFLSPLLVDEGESRQVRVQLMAEDESQTELDTYRISVVSLTGEWIEHCTGVVAALAPQSPPALNRELILTRCHEREIIFDGNRRTQQEQHLTFGARWQSLRRVFVGRNEALAEVELNEAFTAEVSTYSLHPALLDVATGACLYLTANYDGSDLLFLPIAYKRLRLYKSLPARFFSHIRSLQTNADQHEIESFDITLFDEQGDVLAEIEGFAMRRIASPSEAFKQSAQHRATLPAHSGIDAGNEIDPAAGARALMRLLSVETPNIVVAVARPIEELRHPATQPVVGVAKAEALESPLPGDSVEHTLAAWWREMLGVETVAKEDNFFDLGGHSLIGVRLLARIKRTYQVDLDLSHLFEADTIGKLAALIESLRPAGDAGRNEN